MPFDGAFRSCLTNNTPGSNRCSNWPRRPDDPRVLDLVIATVEVLAKDTSLVLDQTHIARDIAGRTKAGDWFGNTELTEIMSDADYLLRVYKRQREEIEQLEDGAAGQAEPAHRA